ncbi:MAG: TRAP transporter small permease [Pseudomonadota bacterium]
MAGRDAPLLRTLDTSLLRVEWAAAVIGGWTIFALMFLVSAEVLLRRLLNSPIPGQQDITILSMATFGVLCVSFCYRQAGHIRMDLLLLQVQGRAHWIMQLLVTLVALLTITAILPGTWNHFLRAFEFGDTTFGIGLPTWPSKLMAPIGLGILWARLVLEIWVFGRLIADPEAEPIGVPEPPNPLEDMDT